MEWGPVTAATSPTEAKVMTVFKQFSRLRVGAELAFIQLRPKVDYTLVFDVYNDGNARDKFNVEIQNYDEMVDEGFQLSLPLISQEIDSLAPPEKFRVQMRTPKNQDGLTNTSHCNSRQLPNTRSDPRAFLTIRYR